MSSGDLAEELRRASHRICTLILSSDLPWIDIALEINAWRERVRTEDPEHLALFDHLYGSRFERLWAQWRRQEESESSWM